MRVSWLPSTPWKLHCFYYCCWHRGGSLLPKAAGIGFSVGVGMKEALRLSLITLLGRRCCRTAAEMQLHNPPAKNNPADSSWGRGKREIQKKQKDLLVKEGKLHHFGLGQLKQCHVKDERGVFGWGILQAGGGWQCSLVCAEMCQPKDSTVWDGTQHLFDQSFYH